jgi:hypothetical protein
LQNTTGEDVFLTVRDMKDQRPTFDHVEAMQCYPNLKEIRFFIGCKGARLSEVAEMEDALRHAADLHPKHPTLKKYFWNAKIEEVCTLCSID